MEISELQNQNLSNLRIVFVEAGSGRRLEVASNNSKITCCSSLKKIGGNYSTNELEVEFLCDGLTVNQK